MIYRILGNTGLKVSAIGLGAEHITFEGYDEICRVVDKCIDAGINYFDFFMAAPHVRTQFGKALGSHRKDIILAVHMGSTASKWVLPVAAIKIFAGGRLLRQNNF